MDIQNILKYMQYGGSEEEGGEGEDEGECIVKCEEQEPTSNPFKLILNFFKCWLPISPKTYKEIKLPCIMQKFINVTIKIFIGLFGIILIPLWPWILITYYSWHSFNKFILTAILGPPGLGLKELIRYIVIIIIIVIGMLFILD